MKYSVPAGDAWPQLPVFTAVRRRGSWLAAVLAYVPVAGALAQPAPVTVERVEITGSRAKVDDSALPITIIQGEDLRRAGVTSVEEALRYLPINQSISGVSQVIGGTTGGRAEANLRALGSNKTLVLLNGRRIANHSYSSGTTDLYAIPIAAIQRIEVLRDGASAIYGTDSVGGVINFITRNDYEGLEVAAENQTPEKAGGRENRVTLTGGYGSLARDGFNVLAVFDHHRQSSIRSVDRDFAASGIQVERGVSRTSGTTFPANVFQPATGVSGNPYFPACRPPESVAIPAVFGPSCRLDYVRFIDLVPQNEQRSWLGRGTFALGADHKATLEYVRTETGTRDETAPSLIFATMTPASPYFPGNGITPGIAGLDPTQNIDVSWRFSAGGKRTVGDNSVAQRAVASLDGRLGLWEYQAGFMRARTKTATGFLKGFTNVVSGGAISRAVQTGDPLFLNPFGDPTPAEQAFINSVDGFLHVDEATGDVSAMDAVLRREFTTAAGISSLAFGAERRREKYAHTPQPITGIAPVMGQRTVSALFAEAVVRMGAKAEAQLAVRHDRYSDVGSATNPKIALRYQPSRAVVLRASANRGFRAPTLYEINQPEAIGNTTDAYDDPLLCPGGVPAAGANPALACRFQQGVRRAGNQALRPEKSTTHSLGIVLQPAPELQVSLDYWNIRLKDRIGELSEQAIFADPARYASRFIRCGDVPPQLLTASGCFAGLGPNPLSLAYIDVPNENLGELRTRGIDVGASYRIAMARGGRLTFTFDGTYVQRHRFQRERDGVFIENTASVVDTLPVFRWQHVVSANWTRGPWSALLVNRYKSGYEDQNDPNALLDPQFRNRVKPYSIWDFTMTWSGIRNFAVTLGVKNIFNQDPPFSNQGSTFQTNYDPRVTDPRGRTFLARVAYTW